jgi:DNA-binding transcriptional regulator LsrR (DeoR family)
MNRKITNVERLAAAYLAGHGNKQAEIARILGISQAVVSRLLANTIGKYWREQAEFIQGDVDEATMHVVLQRIGKNKLAEALTATVQQRSNRKRGPTLRVFSGGSLNATDRERTEEFGRRAAPYVQELLTRSRNCGLTWGRMLWHLVNSLRSSQVGNPWSSHQIDFVPLSGEPLGNNPTTFSSSSLAAELGRIANGGEYHARSIAMVPAFIPEGFTAAQLRGVWKLIGLVPSYNEIFGTHGSSRRKRDGRVVDDLDMILTSVGPASKVLGFGAGRLFETGKLTIERLQSLVIGDMGGVCFPRPNLTPQERRELKSVEVRWTGLEMINLEACATAAEADPTRPGVVVVSGGAARAPFIHQTLEVINHLIIDDTLASELARLMDV